MKTWKRGRKKATPEQKQASIEWQNQRVKIANMVRRKPEIKKVCAVCGKPGHICHNRQDPYYITFICNECEKDPSKVMIAEEKRFDIRTKLNKTYLSSHNFTDEEVVRIVVGYMNDIVSVGDYCVKIGISRHQFNELVKRYKILFPKQPITKFIKKHSDKIQSELLTKITENKSL